MRLTHAVKKSAYRWILNVAVTRAPDTCSEEEYLRVDTEFCSRMCADTFPRTLTSALERCFPLPQSRVNVSDSHMCKRPDSSPCGAPTCRYTCMTGRCSHRRPLSVPHGHSKTRKAREKAGYRVGPLVGGGAATSAQEAGPPLLTPG